MNARYLITRETLTPDGALKQTRIIAIIDAGEHTDSEGTTFTRHTLRLHPALADPDRASLLDLARAITGQLDNQPKDQQ